MADQGTPKSVGIGIAVLTAASALGIGIFTIKSCNDDKPKVWVDGIGMHTPLAEQAANSTTTWPHLKEAVAAIHQELKAKYPKADDQLRDHLWLDLYAQNATITSPLVPIGKVTGSDGKLHEINGTMNAGPMQFAFFGAKDYTALVRKLPGSACRSAFIHEVAQHILPFMLEGNLNPDHEGTSLPASVPANDPRRIPPDKQRWIPLDLAMTKTCTALSK